MMKTRRVQRKNKEILPRHIKCEEQAAESMYDSINMKSSQTILLLCTALPKGKTSDGCMRSTCKARAQDTVANSSC